MLTVMGEKAVCDGLISQGDHSTCLHLACEAGHLDVVQYLCKKGGRELLMKQRTALVRVSVLCMCS